VKSLFDPNVFTETVKRVEALQPSAPRQWGKMTPAQMLEHAARVLDMACGKGPLIKSLAGRLLSWTFR
jgi:ubiquinone/menaquinone biosynthesis C-methylase UbiE